MTFCYEIEDEEEGDEDKLGKSSENEERALTILEPFAASMDWRQILKLPEELHQHIVVALQHSELYADKVKDADPSMKDAAQYTICNMTITFSDGDVLLGSKPHNRPLFVTGYIREQKVKSILVDKRSAVNIMPKSTMNDLGITVDDLSKSQMVIQGFSSNS